MKFVAKKVHRKTCKCSLKESLHVVKFADSGITSIHVFYTTFASNDKGV